MFCIIPLDSGVSSVVADGNFASNPSFPRKDMDSPQIAKSKQTKNSPAGDASAPRAVGDEGAGEAPAPRRRGHDQGGEAHRVPAQLGGGVSSFFLCLQGF